LSYNVLAAILSLQVREPNQLGGESKSGLGITQIHYFYILNKTML